MRLPTIKVCWRYYVHYLGFILLPRKFAKKEIFKALTVAAKILGWTLRLACATFFCPVKLLHLALYFPQCLSIFTGVLCKPFATLWDLRINEGLSLAAWCHVRSHKNNEFNHRWGVRILEQNLLKGCIWGLFDISTSTSDIILYLSICILYIYICIHTCIFWSRDIHIPQPRHPCRTRNYAMSHQETWREQITCAWDGV